MDKTERYRRIVIELIEEYARYKPSHGDITTEAIVDRANDHYEVMHVGWDGVRRVHGSVVHIDIINDKVWIQYDGTSRPVADELIAQGIPRRKSCSASTRPRCVKAHGISRSSEPSSVTGSGLARGSSGWRGFFPNSASRIPGSGWFVFSSQ